MTTPKTVRLSKTSTMARFRALVDSHPDNELYLFSLGKACFDAGDFAQASEHLERAVAQKSDWMVPCVFIGRCAIELGDIEKARTFLARALVLAVAGGHEDTRREIIQLMESLG